MQDLTRALASEVGIERMTWEEYLCPSGVPRHQFGAQMGGGLWSEAVGVFSQGYPECEQMQKTNPSGMCMEHIWLQLRDPRDHHTTGTVAEFVLLGEAGIYASPRRPLSYRGHQPQGRMRHESLVLPTTLATGKERVQREKPRKDYFMITSETSLGTPKPLLGAGR